MLYFFVDTNFFLQCRDARELPWKEVSSSDISILIPRAVMKELDSWKDKGNQRKAQRARNALKIIDEVVSNDIYKVEYKGINVSFVSHQRQDLTKRRENTLDLTKADDLIVNEVLAWKEKNPDKTVKVITGDTNMRSTCKHCEVEFLTIPDDWYLPPENDVKDKKILELERRLKGYENRNPNLEIAVKSQYEFHGDYLVLTIPEYCPMDEHMIQETASRIFSIFPMKKDFPVEFDMKNKALMKLISAIDGWPPSSERIAKYKDEYELWKNDIFKFLRQIHKYAKYKNFKSEFPHLSLSLLNNGGAPADDLIIDFSVSDMEKMSFMMGLKEFESEIYAVPEVPKPPEKGDRLRQIQSGEYSLFGSNFISVKQKDSGRDINTFYKKNKKGCRLSYECKQFRHHGEEKLFDFYFSLNPDIKNKVNSEFQCKITAKNIPFPIEKSIKISLTQEIKPLNDYVNWFIEKLHSY